jgi:membrane protein
MKIFRASFYKTVFTLLKGSFTGFMNDRGLKLSASLAYYTVFSLGPLLLLIISLAGLFLGKDASQGKIFSELNELIGAEAALQIQEMLKNIALTGKSTMAVIIGSVTLLIGATTVFGEIQDSINLIWKVKAKPKRGWLKLIKDRLLSSSLIVVLGFLLVVSLIANGVLLVLSDRLLAFFPEIAIVLVNLLNLILSYVVIAALFAVIFKVLPDVKIGWKDVRVGAFFTSFLFLVGRYLIGLYIQKTETGVAFGAAGAVIIILVWVYYTAAILYFGAEFTQVYAEHRGTAIAPAEYAVHIEQQEVQQDVAVLPPQGNLEK